MKVRTLLFVTTCLGAQASQAQDTLPFSVSGPLPVSADSHPFGGAAHTRIPQDLAASGYVEEEYFLSGKGKVYEWPEGGDPVVQSDNAPYTTRVLVRRPRDAARFSGNVVVEMLNPSNRMDLNIGWSISHEEWTRNGDAWVGVTVKPISVVAMQTFDPVRYAALSWANPLPLDDSRNCQEVAADSQRSTENGLAWEVFRHAGQWLRSSESSNPFAAGYAKPVEHLYAWGYSQTGNFLYTYVNAMHPQDVAMFSGPLYDAYLIGVPVGGTTNINQCSPRMGDDDPRRQITDAGVPVMRIMSQSDYQLGIRWRREDSDAPTDPFRNYEITGSGHATPEELNYGPAPVDIEKAGVAVPPMSCNEGPRSRFPNSLFFNAAFRNLDQWVREGVAPPRAAPIQTDAEGKAVADEHGNLLGGVRSPFVDVPTALWTGASTGESFCFIAGHEVPFTSDKLKALYGSKDGYLEALRKSIDELVAQRFIVAADGEKLLQEAQTMTPDFE